MKLVDILARELKVWPDALGHAVGQSSDGTLHCEMEPADTEIVWTSEKYTVCKKYMSDCVTRAEWRAAVDALNATKVIWRSGDMSDLMREEFEAWAVIDNRYSIARTYTDLRYDEDDTEAAWGAWQSSRECLVIELPKPTGMDRMSSEMSMQEIREDNRFNRALELAKKALTAAGVKYK